MESFNEIIKKLCMIYPREKVILSLINPKKLREENFLGVCN